MLRREIWKAVAKYGENFLCLECVETRLGNSLTLESFINYPINKGIFGFDAKDYIEWKKKNPWPR